METLCNTHQNKQIRKKWYKLENTNHSYTYIFMCIYVYSNIIARERPSNKEMHK
jgi:hypothetical protein